MRAIARHRRTRKAPLSGPSVRWLCLIGLFAQVAACSRPASQGANPQSPSPRAASTVNGGPHAIVARVNGEGIPLAALQRLETTTPRKALEALIRFELLAQEAARRGLQQRPSIVEVRKRALALHLIERDFGRHYTEASVPEGEVSTAYQRLRGTFRHGELKVVQHLLVPTAPNAKPDEKAASKARAERLHGEVEKLAKQGQLNLASFSALAEGAAKTPSKLISEKVYTGRRGYTVRPFANAAFALKTPGDYSGVVATRYGFHVLLLLETQPAANRSVDEVAPALRKALFPESRRRAFQRFAQKLEQAHHVELYADRIRRPAATKARR